jgi:hypothetical protein
MNKKPDLRPWVVHTDMCFSWSCGCNYRKKRGHTRNPRLRGTACYVRDCTCGLDDALKRYSNPIDEESHEN